MRGSSSGCRCSRRRLRRLLCALVVGCVLLAYQQGLLGGLNPAAKPPAPNAQPECAIPRIVHQTWKTESVSGTFARHMRTWVQKNPGWEYWFWTDDAAAAMIKQHFPKFWPMYSGYATPIQRADAIRYFILAKYGGVYADLDFECLRALDDITCAHSAIIGQEPFAHSHVLYDIDRMLCNALMASAPNHLLWATVHDELYTRRVTQKIKTVRATGPRMLSYAVERYENSTLEAYGSMATVPRVDTPDTSWSTPAEHAIYIPSPETFYPLFDAGNTVLREKCGKAHLSARQRATCDVLVKHHFQNTRPNASVSFAVHHWAHTWLGHQYESQIMNVREAIGDNASTYARHQKHKHKNAHKYKINSICEPPGGRAGGAGAGTEPQVHAIRCKAIHEVEVELGAHA